MERMLPIIVKSVVWTGERGKKQKSKILHTEEEVKLSKLEEVRLALQFLKNNTALHVDRIGGGGVQLLK